MEINTAYRSLIKVLKTHGVTEWSVPPQGDPASLKVSEFIACPNIDWTDQAGIKGELRLTVSPIANKTGLVELTMRALRADRSAGSRVLFCITESGITAKPQRFCLGDWVDLPSVDGLKYENQLIRTASILDQKFKQDETQ